MKKLLICGIILTAPVVALAQPKVVVMGTPSMCPDQIKIHVDNLSPVNFNCDGKTEIAIDPGKHWISLNDSHKASIDVTDENYYIEISRSSPWAYPAGGSWIPSPSHTKLQPVSKEYALQRLGEKN